MKKSEHRAELTAPILAKDEDRRIVLGPVLVPDEPDLVGDVVTVAEIERVAHRFMRDYGNIDLLHTLNNCGSVVESYLAPQDLDLGGTIVPKGSWIMGVYVEDDEVWASVKSGTLTGFSIMAVSQTVAKAAAGSDLPLEVGASDFSWHDAEPAVRQAVASKGQVVHLDELGEEWIVNFVSLVDEPCVPRAKFLVVKRRGDLAAMRRTADGEAVRVDRGEEVAAAEKFYAPIIGSFEHVRRQIERELARLYPDWAERPVVEAIFPDEVILQLYDRDGSPTDVVRQSYDYDETSGALEFVGDAVRVAFQTIVVDPDEEAPIAARSGGGWLDAFRRVVGGATRAAGLTVVDDENEGEIAASVKEAVAAAVNPNHEGESMKDDERNEVVSAVKDAVSSAVKPLEEKVGEFGDELTSVKERLDALEGEGQGEASSDAETEPATKSDEGDEPDAATKGDGDGRIESLEEQMNEVIDLLKKQGLRGGSIATAAGSRQPVGQDGDGETKEPATKGDPNRDEFGRWVGKAPVATV